MKVTAKILITGATGFVGQALLERLLEYKACKVVVALRYANGFDRCVAHEVGEFSGTPDFSRALSKQEVVIHAAARAHIMKDEVVDPLAEYRKVNVEGTLNLARQSAAAGVKRFIFIGSIKINGERTAPGQPFKAEDEVKPTDPYGISKWEAEQGLLQIAKETAMEVVIIRPPLVYGPGVKGNFANLIKLMSRGLPLPLGAIHNRRSYIALDNLIDLIITCIDHPNAANQVFLASDGRDLSTTELLKGLARAMGKPARLLPMPSALLTFAASALGKKLVADRLLSSLQVDISKTQDLLGWTPPISVDEGLRRCFDSQEDRP